jgi:aspartyl-tRNA(Asn)/glutamyl-tRNA(Gln) amidotransferase subunit C
VSHTALSTDDARKAAHLARLALTEAELATLTPQLASIVEYVAQLQAVNTEGVEPLAHPHDSSCVFREDEPAPSLPAETALAQSPGRQGPYHSVPAVLE